MPEPAQYKFTYQELAEMMIEKAGVTEGHWGLQIFFGLAASNVGPNENELKPAAIVVVTEIGLQRFEKPTNLSIDAGRMVGRGAKVTEKRLVRAGGRQETRKPQTREST